MNRYRIIAYILIISILTLALTACSPNKVKVGEGRYFSNLYDNESQDYLVSVLQSNNISKEGTQNVLQLVQRYNKQFEDIPVNKEGIEEADSFIINYDEVTATNIWYEFSNNIYSDVNCRVFSYAMVKDFIKTEKIFEGNSNNLMFDQSCIYQYLKEDSSSYDINSFTAFFATMYPPELSSKQDVASFIVKEWKDRGISFPLDMKAKVVNMFFYDKEFNEIFVGHSGVLMEVENGFVYVEKHSPTLPYQLFTFNDRADLIDYFGKRFEAYASESNTIVLMENDRLLSD